MYAGLPGWALRVTQILEWVLHVAHVPGPAHGVGPVYASWVSSDPGAAPEARLDLAHKPYL